MSEIDVKSNEKANAWCSRYSKAHAVANGDVAYDDDDELDKQTTLQ